MSASEAAARGHQIANIASDQSSFSRGVKGLAASGIEFVVMSPQSDEGVTLQHAAARTGRLTEADAIDIWIARWLRIRRVDLLRRYGCDPRRLYEIWEERRFVGTRDKALALLSVRYPTLRDRVDCGPHRRISLTPDPSQLSFFDPIK